MGEPNREKQPLDIREFIDRHTRILRENHRGFTEIFRVPYKQVELVHLLKEARQVFESQKTLLYIKAPVVIIGDIHGQFRDLLRLLYIMKPPPAANYLFLGDYVDRGRQSLECIALLLAYKVLYPRNVFLLRGNHECANINRVYGFYDEMNVRFGNSRLWRCFQSVFDMMPLAGLVSGRILCMHGGISPELDSLDRIREIQRPLNYGIFMKKGLPCDLLWADPDFYNPGWTPSIRGISYNFGERAVKETCKKLNLDLIVRAHQVVEDGFQFFADRKLITIFSAVNYTNEYNNNGAILIIGKDLWCQVRIIHAKPLRHPKTTPTGSAASDR